MQQSSYYCICIIVIGFVYCDATIMAFWADLAVNRLFHYPFVAFCSVFIKTNRGFDLFCHTARSWCLPSSWSCSSPKLWHRSTEPCVRPSRARKQSVQSPYPYSVYLGRFDSSWRSMGATQPAQLVHRLEMSLTKTSGCCPWFDISELYVSSSSP